MRQLKQKPSRGFTIIELLVATLVFSIVLVVVLASFIQISRLFYKGVNTSNTQDDTRTVLNDISSDIQFLSATTPAPVCSYGNNCSNFFCIGDHRYTFYVGAQVGTTSPAGIYRENVTANCPPPGGSVSGSAEQLLGDGMQLNNLQISCAGGICRVKIHVVFYGGNPAGLFSSANYAHQYANDLWKAPDAECTGALISSQFCSTADYSSTVLQKV